MEFSDWMTVDCDVCGAAFGEPCRSETSDCSCCEAIRAKLQRGEAYCAGGNRERVAFDLDATPGRPGAE